MKRAAKILAFALIGLTSSKGVRAEAGNTDKTAYATIAKRNVFGLTDKPVFDPIPEPPAAPSGQIRLSGITSIFGDRRALFIVQDPATPGSPAPKEEYYMLSEGQSQSGYEVVSIDEKHGTVQLKHDGFVTQLALPAPKFASLPPAREAAATHPPAPTVRSRTEAAATAVITAAISPPPPPPPGPAPGGTEQQ